jgi:hypothetical protein
VIITILVAQVCGFICKLLREVTPGFSHLVIPEQKLPVTACVLLANNTWYGEIFSIRAGEARACGHVVPPSTVRRSGLDCSPTLRSKLHTPFSLAGLLLEIVSA